MTSLYFLAFAFLASTSLLFLLWHCRLSQLRQQELRRLEEEQQEREQELAEARAVAALSGLTLLARGAPSSLIRSLPTFSYSTAKNAAAAAAAAVARDEEDGQAVDVEMGGSRPDQRLQGSNSTAPVNVPCSGVVGGEGSSSTTPAMTTSAAAVSTVESRPSTSFSAAGGAGPASGVAQARSEEQGGAAGGSTTAAAAAAAAVASLEECVICLCGYEEGDTVKRLPCGHHYHAVCVDEWLRKAASCPLCKTVLWPSTQVSVLPLVDLELLALLHHQLVRPIAGGGGSGRWGATTAAAAAAVAAANPRADRRSSGTRAADHRPLTRLLSDSRRSGSAPRPAHPADPAAAGDVVLELSSETPRTEQEASAAVPDAAPRIHIVGRRRGTRDQG